MRALGAQAGLRQNAPQGNAPQANGPQAGRGGRADPAKRPCRGPHQSTPHRMTLPDFGQPLLAPLLALLAATLDEVLSSPQQIAAYLAAAAGAALVVAGAFVKTMIPLRWLAVGGNLGFLAFGVLHPSPTTLMVALTLLPINLYRVREMTRLTRRVSEAEASGNLSGVWLKPYMKPRKLRAGQVLFRKGDRANHLYLLAEGRLELVELGREIPPGRVFGEIALFSPARRRTNTVRCATACTVLMIDEGTVKQLYYQNPSFGFHLIGLVAARLSEDVERAEFKLSQSQGGVSLDQPEAEPGPPPAH